MKRKFCFLLVWIFPTLLCANTNVDSLKNIIKTGPDSARLVAYELLSNYYKNVNFDSCVIICEAGSKLAEKMQKAPQMNLFPTNLGTIYYQKGEFDKAVFYFFEALKISEKYNDTARIAQTLNNLGIINMYSGENEKALEYLKKAKEIKQKLKNNELTIAITNMNIGIIYKNMGDYDLAYTYFIMALPEIEKSQSKNILAPIYNNIGIVFLFRKQYEKALKYYLNAEKYADSYLSAYNRAVLMQNIGECYIYLKNPAESFKYLEKGLNLALANNYLHVQKNIYNVFCDYYVEIGDYHQAYKYRERYDVVKDSLFSVDKKTAFDELQTKYETEKKEQENQILSEKVHSEKLETMKQKKINRLIVLAAFLILITSLLMVYFSNKIRLVNIKLRKSSAELQKLNIDLKLSKDQIEAALQFKSQFLANMSHEIRTPLNIIIGFNAMLRKNISDAKLSTFIDAIEVSSNNLLQLLNDILDLSKMEAGKMCLTPESIELPVMLEEIRKLFILRAEEKGINFSVELEPTVPKGLVIDEVRLRQVLVNLIGNAVKFTESGFVRLHVFVEQKKNNYISSTPVTDIIFEIEDSGIGISIKDQAEIFESFKQIKMHIQKRLGGTGLGLPISKRLTEMMGGEILVNSDLGRGSKFSVHLKDIPIVQIASGERNNSGSFSESTDIQFGKGSIIIADDEELNRSLIRACFENTMVVVYEAETAEEAFEMTLTHLPNLVMMDLKMPDKDGFEAAKMIKQDDSLKAVPIIAFTASQLYEDHHIFDNNLFVGFISKPVFVNELYEEVARFIPHTRKSKIIDVTAIETEFEKILNGDKAIITADIFNTLEKEFLRDWTQVCQSNSMNKIQEFAEKLHAFSTEKNLISLKNYTEEIITFTKSFDIDNVRTQIKKFPEIIQIIKPGN